MDALAEILNAFPVSATLYCRLEARQPWGIGLPESDDAQFHAVRSGTCWVRVGRAKPVRLTAGDFVIIPRGQAHQVLDSPETPVSSLEDAMTAAPSAPHRPILPIGGTGPASTLLCGAFRFTHRRANPVLACLPEWIHLRVGNANASTLDAVLQMADAEVDSGAPGSSVVLARLADVVMVEALRSYMAQLPKSANGMLAALADERLGGALRSLHADPGRKWTIDEIARNAGVSRSSLTARFRERLGESPRRYLARWRLMMAAGRIENGEDSLKQLAAEAGYSSPSAFSRAFARMFGVPPGKYRHLSKKL